MWPRGQLTDYKDIGAVQSNQILVSEKTSNATQWDKNLKKKN